LLESKWITFKGTGIKKYHCSKAVSGEGEEDPAQVAFRAKKLGIYKEQTWSDFHQRVAGCAMGLMKLGLGLGEHLALMAIRVRNT